jgi:hypothetical protein
MTRDRAGADWRATLRTAVIDALLQGGKVVVGGLLSGSVVVLQYAVSRAAQSGSGPSLLDDAHFGVYLNTYVFGYVALVSVISLALVFADTVRDAMHFAVLPLILGLGAFVVLRITGERAAEYAPVVAYTLFWSSACWISRPPPEHLGPLQTLAPLQSRAAWWRWLRGKATEGVAVSDETLRQTLDVSAQRSVVLLLLLIAQLSLTVWYAFSVNTRSPYRFDPRPTARLANSQAPFTDTASALLRPLPPVCATNSCPTPFLSIDSAVPAYLTRRDRLARLRRLDSLTGSVVLRRAYLHARYCRPDSAPRTRPLDSTWYRVAAATDHICDTVLRSAALAGTRQPDSMARTNEKVTTVLFNAEIALHDEFIQTVWAEDLDRRHAWLIITLGTLLVALIAVLGVALRRLEKAPADPFTARSRLDEQEPPVRRFTSNERAIGALAVVIIAMVPLLRTVNPASLNIEKPRSVFGGSTWSTVPVEDDSTRQARSEGAVKVVAVDTALFNREFAELRAALTRATVDTAKLYEKFTTLRDSLAVRADRIQSRTERVAGLIDSLVADSVSPPLPQEND